MYFRFLRCVGDVSMSAHRYQSNPTRQTHEEDGGGLALIRPVLSQHARYVYSAVRDSNEVPAWRCCVCTTGLKPPELRCSNNFNAHFFSPSFSPPSALPLLLRSRHWISRGQLLWPNEGSARSLVNSQTNIAKNAAAEVFTFLRRSPSSAHRRFTNT